MEKVANQIKSFFDETSWKYTYDDENNIFRAGISMNAPLGDLNVIIFLKNKNYTVYVPLNNKADSASFCNVSEFLNRANYGLKNGNFEMDYSDGEIRYKAFVDFSDREISNKVVANSILMPIFMIDRYGEDLLKVILGEETPEEGIQNAESKED